MRIPCCKRCCPATTSTSTSRPPSWGCWVARAACPATIPSALPRTNTANATTAHAPFSTCFPAAPWPCFTRPGKNTASSRPATAGTSCRACWLWPHASRARARMRRPPACTVVCYSSATSRPSSWRASLPTTSACPATSTRRRAPWTCWRRTNKRRWVRAMPCWASAPSSASAAAAPTWPCACAWGRSLPSSTPASCRAPLAARRCGAC
ncbi:hypothetical protein D3C72_1538150 [compost metagenome]